MGRSTGPQRQAPKMARAHCPLSSSERLSPKSPLGSLRTRGQFVPRVTVGTGVREGKGGSMAQGGGQVGPRCELGASQTLRAQGLEDSHSGQAWRRAGGGSA